MVGCGTTGGEDLDEASTPRSLAWAAAALEEELPGAAGATGSGAAGRAGVGAGFGFPVGSALGVEGGFG